MTVASIADALRGQSELQPDRPAIVATLYDTLTYRQLHEVVGRARSDLRQAGFAAEDRIAVAVPGGPIAAVALVAVASSATAVPVDTKLAAPEIERRLLLLRPAAVALRADDDGPARAIAARCNVPVVAIRTPGSASLRLQLAAPRIGDASTSAAPSGDAAAFILQTSGTTGDPKLIPFSHRNMLAAAARVQAWFGLTAQDRCLSVAPLHYSHGIKMTVFTPLLTGGSIAFPTDAGRLDVDEWLGTLAPTWYSASPTLHRFVLDKVRPLADARHRHSLRFAVSGGAPLPVEVGRELADRLGVPVLEHYGTSEAAQIAANVPGAARPGTCGIPAAGTLRIAREDGSAAPAGEQGEVWVRGPTLSAGYLEAPAADRAAFADGWFRTGDLGSLDADGFLTLHGRRKELINRGGEKIAPTEIDAALLRHPAISEAAAYAVPHPRLGEDVAAAVVLQPGASATQEDLRAYLGTQVAWFKVPRRIVFLDALPKGLTGKVQRQKLGAATS